MVQVNVPEARRGNALAIAALVLGILAALVCWIPFLGLAAIPVGGLGLILGLIATVVAFAGTGTGRVAAVVGSAISFGAILLSVAVTGSTSEAISDAIKKDSGPVGRADGPQPPEASRPRGPQAGLPVGIVNPAAAGAPAKEAPEAEWVLAPTPVRLGDVQVRITWAALGQVPLKGATGEGFSEKPHLSLGVEITNTNPNRKISYNSWEGADITMRRDYATLQDNFGNSYKRINFGILDHPVGHIASDSIYPNKTITDVIVFEPPIDTVQHLDVELPGENVEAEGVFRIRIPAALIRR